jgi:hypothetical protein
VRQVESKIKLLPDYGRLKTIPDFTKMAGKFALTRKAIAELKKVEEFFLRGGVTKSDFKAGLQEMADFAGMVENNATAALLIVNNMRKKVAAYEKELVDAVG